MKQQQQQQKKQQQPHNDGSDNSSSLLMKLHVFHPSAFCCFQLCQNESRLGKTLMFLYIFGAVWMHGPMKFEVREKTVCNHEFV